MGSCWLLAWWGHKPHSSQSLSLVAGITGVSHHAKLSLLIFEIYKIYIMSQINWIKGQGYIQKTWINDILILQTVFILLQIYFREESCFT
jgi:hypothetical protein